MAAEKKKVLKREKKPVAPGFSRTNFYYDNIPVKVDETRTDLHLGVRWERMKIRVIQKDGSKIILHNVRHLITPLVSREMAVAKGLDNRKIHNYRRFKILRIVQEPWRSE